MSSAARILDDAPEPCGSGCLPRYGLHDVVCDAANRRDPILSGHYIGDREPTFEEITQDAIRDDHARDAGLR